MRHTRHRKTTMRRVAVLLLASLAISNSGAIQAKPDLPPDVVGIELPRTALALKAAQLARQSMPTFLFNHSIRTYVFGALGMKAKGAPFDPETAFVAAALHDIGLLARYESPKGSFEVDSATIAENFVKENGGTQAQARIVWNAIAMHDMGRAFQSHQSGEALLLGYGAATDVDGPDDKVIAPAIVAETLRSLPRANFKTAFLALAAEHCKRKPVSQSGWLDGLCREVAPNVDRGSVRTEIMSASYAE